MDPLHHVHCHVPDGRALLLLVEVGVAPHNTKALQGTVSRVEVLVHTAVSSKMHSLDIAIVRAATALLVALERLEVNNSQVLRSVWTILCKKAVARSPSLRARYGYRCFGSILT